jgi:hypothetical protein
MSTVERRTPVRCSEGHVYGSRWVPMVSLKAIRLGNARFQHCPVCHRRRMTTRVPPDQLTVEVLAAAAAIHDGPLP